MTRFYSTLIGNGDLAGDDLTITAREMIADNIPLCSLVYRHQLLTTGQQLEILKIQVEEQIEYVEALAKSEYGTESMMEKVKLLQDDGFISVLDRLIRKEKIDINIILKNLDIFLSDFSQRNESAK